VQHRTQLQLPSVICRAIRVSLICGKLKIFLSLSQRRTHNQTATRRYSLLLCCLFIASLAVEAANQEIIRGLLTLSEKKKCLPSFFS
jgi:hypothetical protein